LRKNEEKGEAHPLKKAQRVGHPAGRRALRVRNPREGDQPLRWAATGLLEAEKRFRRIKGYQGIMLLKERLNPSRIQQKEVRTVEVA
jgi:hypothetical protein